MRALTSLSLAGLALTSVAGAPQGDAIRLIIRGDDIGSSHTANIACIQSYREGIMQSVEIMAPTPWYTEAVDMLRDNPGLDVGVHLTLTSEWSACKWGPITPARTLVDDLGHFFPFNSQLEGAPPNTGFLDANPDLAEVEEELRAQIRIALRDIPSVSHLSAHMGTPVLTPELAAITERLSAEFALPIDFEGLEYVGGFGDSNDPPEQRAQALADKLMVLGPGAWLLVEHPGLDTDEMRSLGTLGYENVAQDRAGVTAAFTSPKVREVIEQRGIELISYADLGLLGP